MSLNVTKAATPPRLIYVFPHNQDVVFYSAFTLTLAHADTHVYGHARQPASLEMLRSPSASQLDQKPLSRLPKYLQEALVVVASEDGHARGHEAEAELTSASSRIIVFTNLSAC